MAEHDLKTLDVMTLEALSRKEESRARLLSSREAKEASDAESKLDAINKELESRTNLTPVRDLEGTAQVLSDALGNFPDSAEQSAAGGIGIKTSNSQSVEKTQEQLDAIAAFDAATAGLSGLGTDATEDQRAEAQKALTEAQKGVEAADLNAATAGTAKGKTKRGER